MHILVGLVSYCLRGSGSRACIQYVTVYSCNWDDGDLVSPPSLSPSLQPRLLQKPHRFLRDPLLRSDPARDGGLDHAVHNRIRPDVRLRLPAGVEEEEEGGGAGGRESRVSPVGREVWTDGPPRSLPPAKPLPPPPGVHIRAMLFSGALAFFGPSLPHRSNDFGKKRKKKSARTRMLLRGNTTPTPRPSLSPAPHHHHLYYYYYYYYYSTASDFITVPPLLSDPSTSSLLPSPLDGALLPGTNGEERGRRTRGFPK